MIKTYCDICGDEITNQNIIGVDNFGTHIQIPKSKETLKILLKIVVKTNTTVKEIDCCRYCLIDVVKKMDDRIRPAKEFKQFLTD